MDSHDESLSTQALFTKESSVAPGEIVIGELVGFSDSGEPQVTFPNANGSAFSALSTVAVTHQHKGRQLALLFANGDLSQPVIMGLIHSPLLDLLSNIEVASSDDEPMAENKESDAVAMVDGQRVVLEAKEEIVLRCGAASITLTKDGKIQIRGKSLLNRASGINRIMGGSVQVN